MAAEPHPAACLAGPTGCGKTALAVKLAALCGCEIINADSRQLYADFPIITAQPKARERGGIAHHLYGILKTGEKLDAASWARLAAAKAAEIRQRGNIPLFVGGSGFYLAALFDGLSDIPPIPREISTAIEAEMAQSGPIRLHARLEQVDPETAAKIHPHDRQRIMRGLEVAKATGKPLSWWQARPLRPLCTGPRLFMTAALEELTPFLAARIKAMLACGAAEEALNAYSRCADLSAPGWSGIGCVEALALAKSPSRREELTASWLYATRQYAKRQLTWFRNRKGYLAFHREPDSGIIERIRSLAPAEKHL